MVCGVQAQYGYDEVEQLTAGQRSTIRRAIRDAAANIDVSDPAFRATCEKYQKMYGISYDAIRFLMGWQLPTAAPKLPQEQGKSTPKPQEPAGARHESNTRPGITSAVGAGQQSIEHLTAQQAARVRKAYRKASASENQHEEIHNFYVKYEALYGIRREILHQIVTAERQQENAKYVPKQECSAKMPSNLASWIDGLSYGPKRKYAEEYALARLGDHREPPVPAISRKNWPRRTRQRVDQLLKQAGFPGGGWPSGHSTDAADRGSSRTDISWHERKHSEPGVTFEYPRDTENGFAVNQDTGFLQSIELIRRWLSVVNEGSFTFRQLLNLDPDELPPDIREALIEIENYAITCPREHIAATQAVERLLMQFEKRDQDVLRARLWADSLETLGELAARLGVTRERIRQVQERAKEKLGRLLTQSANRPVAWCAHELRQKLGPYIPVSIAEDRLRDLDVSTPSDVASVLLYLAGPYRPHDGGWLEHAPTAGSRVVASVVEAAFESSHHVPTETVIEALSKAGMSRDVADLYLREVAPVRHWDGVCLRWQGSVVDKAFAVLDARGVPATAEAINDMIAEGHSLGTLKNGMSKDSRFVRTGKRSWGLRAWGVEEYSGIVEEIFERIDASGGAIDLDKLVNVLVTAFPDVSENSIRMYLGTMAFVIEGGIVRRRTENDGWPISAHFKDARGAFHRGDSEVRLAIPVTRDVIRGSGQAVHPAVALALDVRPDTRRVFTSGNGAVVTVAWRPWSTTGPDIGSVRSFALETQAKPGDTLVLIFTLDSGTLSGLRVLSEADDAERLVAMLGAIPGDDLTIALAGAMDCRASEVRSVLRARGEGALAEVIPATADTRLETEIASLIAELR